MSRFEDAQNTPGRPTWAEINLNNLAANFKRIRDRVSPAARVMAVVKANAYGHGLVPTVLALADADAFAVARLEEGIALRNAGREAEANRLLSIYRTTTLKLPQRGQLGDAFEWRTISA